MPVMNRNEKIINEVLDYPNEVNPVGVAKEIDKLYADKVKIIPAGMVIPDDTTVPEMDIEITLEESPVPDKEIIPPVTEITVVSPQRDSQVIALMERGVKVLTYAENFAIENATDVRKATTDLALVKGLKDQLEVKRSGK